MNEKKRFVVPLASLLLLLPCGILCAAPAGLPSVGEKKASGKNAPELIERYRRGLPRDARGPRYFIIRDLGLSRDKRAVPFLTSLVETGDPEEKVWAVDALAVHGDTEAVTVLRRALEDPGSLAVPVGQPPETATALSTTTLQVHALNGLLRMNETELAYPWVERFVFEKKINVLGSLVVPRARTKGLLAKLEFRDKKAEGIMLRALECDEIDLGVAAAYYLAQNGFRNETMYRVAERAWPAVRDDHGPGSGMIKGHIIGTLKLLKTRKARKKLAEIERYLAAERGRPGR